MEIKKNVNPSLSSTSLYKITKPVLNMALPLYLNLYYYYIIKLIKGGHYKLKGKIMKIQ